jgi:hypothetical protein
LCQPSLAIRFARRKIELTSLRHHDLEVSL